jgi:uncharacterized repeat protein (TIGR03803 family)
MTQLSAWKRAGAVLLLCAATAIVAEAQDFDTLVIFHGANGANPSRGSLVQGHDGNLYGTTTSGGNLNCEVDYYGCGTVFKITPLGKLTRIYNFCPQPGQCGDGAFPYAGLALATDGNFYGTAFGGQFTCPPGNAGCGTVFKITPDGILTALHQFDGTDGDYPYAGLIQATDGNFYGTTYQGGTDDVGTVFKISTTVMLTTLHEFDFADGEAPLGALVEATNGSFYGTTYYGGLYGDGTIFKVTPAGALTTLDGLLCSPFHCTDSDGATPSGGLLQATDGNLYGTTYFGGNGICRYGCGTVGRITPQGKPTLLYSFCSQPNCTDGDAPYSGLIQGTDGNCYGTTQLGGDLTCDPPNGCGTLFRITLDGTLTTLHSFHGTDGDQPFGSLAQATNGKFYGTTSQGSDYSCGYPYGCGTIFSLDVGLGPFVTFVRAAGKVGQTGPILGQGFTGTTNVSINGIPGTFTVVSDTFIRATVPVGATTGYVTVTTPSGTLTSNVPFHVIR